MPKIVPREFTIKSLQQALKISSQNVQDNLVAKGLPRYVMEDGVIVRIAPNGARRRLRKAGAAK